MSSTNLISCFSTEIPNDSKEERLSQSIEEGTDADKFTESSTSNTSKSDMSSDESKKDGQRQEALSVRSDCRPVPTVKIKTQIKNMLSDVKAIEKAKKQYRFKVTINIADLDKKKEAIIKNTAKVVAGELKWTTAQVQKTTIENINTKLKEKHINVFPNERLKLKEETEKLNDNLSCAFRNIMDGLETVALGLLEDMACLLYTSPSPRD